MHLALRKRDRMCDIHQYFEGSYEPFSKSCILIKHLENQSSILNHFMQQPKCNLDIQGHLLWLIILYLFLEASPLMWNGMETEVNYTILLFSYMLFCQNSLFL